MRVDELVPLQEWKNRPLQQAYDVHLREHEKRHADAYDQRRQRPDDAPSQLLEMIEERHLIACGRSRVLHVVPESAT